MATDSMTVRLHLYRIRVVEVVVDLPERLEVVVRDLRPVVRCPHCGYKTSKVHETRPQRIKDVPRGAQQTTLVWLRRRFRCTACDERHTEKHPAIEGRITARLARRIVAEARHQSITEISRRHGLSWDTVMRLVREWMGRIGPQRRRRPCRVLLVDETSLRRRHRYVSVVSNAETGEALAVLAHRDARALSSFFLRQGRRWCSRVKVVVSDGSQSYRRAIQTHVGAATHVLDRFHVVRWFAQGLIGVRRRVQRVGSPGERPVFTPEVFRTRYLQLARSEHLSPDRHVRLTQALSKDPELWHAWRLVQMLYGVYDAPDEADRSPGSDRFCCRRVV